MGAGFQYPFGVISPANCSDATVTDNRISSLIETRVHHNKQEMEDLQAKPVCFSTNEIVSNKRKKPLLVWSLLGIIG